MSAKDVRPQAVVHVVPGRLHQFAIGIESQYLQEGDDELVRMFDVDTESQYFEEPPLRFDHLILDADVRLVQKHGTGRLTRPPLLQVIEDIDHVPQPAGRLFDLTRQCDARSRGADR